jgi:4-diphosphocytidyl-2-C-methyl-D-erythritol kinase
MKNLLENVTLRRYSILREIKDGLIKDGALGSMMSGSGPTIFGFFDDMLTAQNCFLHMKEKYEEVYITRTI